MKRRLFASFEEFLRSGKLGELRCGLTSSEVESLLGEPEFVEKYPGDCGLWSYGALEVRFFNSKVDSFGIGLAWGPGDVSDCIQVRDSFPERDTPITEIENLLETHGIQFERGRNGIDLRTSAGVWVCQTAEGKVMSITAQDREGRLFLDEMLRKTPET